MYSFSESQIQKMISALKWEWGIESNTRELAILELEDLQRKGCSLENIGECRGCSACNSGECPMNNWEKRHPEYVNDELAKKIEVLEAGGEEAWKAKQKVKEEARRKAEEERQRATDTDKVEACRVILSNQDSFATEDRVLEAIGRILESATKAEIQEEVAKAKSV